MATSSWTGRDRGRGDRLEDGRFEARERRLRVLLNLLLATGLAVDLVGQAADVVPAGSRGVVAAYAAVLLAGCLAVIGRRMLAAVHHRARPLPGAPPRRRPS